MSRAVSLSIGLVLVVLLACEETIVPLQGGPPLSTADSTTIPLGGTVDIIDGIRYYTNVHVEGTLTYHTVFSDETARPKVQVNLHVALRFRRTCDYQGVTQNWHAGGKSEDILDLREDQTALVHKIYQLWGVAKQAFVNIEFLVQQSGVSVHNIWVSYEYPE